MHELAIAQEIHRGSRAAVAKYGPGKLQRVRVAVGELTAVEPELLVLAWEALTSNGPDAGAALDVEWRAANQRCPACEADQLREPGSWNALCAGCGGPLVVTGGLDLDLLQVVFSAEDEREDGLPAQETASG